MSQLENPSEFARLYLAAIERVKAQGRGRLTELGKAIGSRQRIYDPQTKPRAVGLEVVMVVADHAKLTKQEAADIVRAWLMERIESGAVGQAVVEICRGLDSIPTIVHRALARVDGAGPLPDTPHLYAHAPNTTETATKRPTATRNDRRSPMMTLADSALISPASQIA